MKSIKLMIPDCRSISINKQMIALKCFIYNQYIKMKNIKKNWLFFLQSFSHIIIIGST